MFTSDAPNISIILGLYTWQTQYYFVDINQGGYKYFKMVTTEKLSYYFVRNKHYQEYYNA